MSSVFDFNPHGSMAHLTKVTPVEVHDGEYTPSPGDLVMFSGASPKQQVYQIIRVTPAGQVIYKALDNHYADSLKTLRRLGMEQL